VLPATNSAEPSEHFFQCNLSNYVTVFANRSTEFETSFKGRHEIHMDLPVLVIHTKRTKNMQKEWLAEVGSTGVPLNSHTVSGILRLGKKSG